MVRRYLAIWRTNVIFTIWLLVLNCNLTFYNMVAIARKLLKYSKQFIIEMLLLRVRTTSETEGWRFASGLGRFRHKHRVANKLIV